MRRRFWSEILWLKMIMYRWLLREGITHPSHLKGSAKMLAAAMERDHSPQLLLSTGLLLSEEARPVA
jgi:hypothetical protein